MPLSQFLRYFTSIQTPALIAILMAAPRLRSSSSSKSFTREHLNLQSVELHRIIVSVVAGLMTDEGEVGNLALHLECSGLPTVNQPLPVARLFRWTPPYLPDKWPAYAQRCRQMFVCHTESLYRLEYLQIPYRI